MEAALRMLSRRDHTMHELCTKLHEKGFSAEAVDRAVHQCRHLGYLDDAKTAKALAEQLIRRGYGPLRIRETLSGKGLDEDIIHSVLEQDDNNGTGILDTAKRALEKKRSRFDREPDPHKQWQKAFRFLAGRGFSADVIRKALDGFFIDVNN
ncbi:recombination regulator RecX [Desulfosarcina sp. OttesenSCG-928-G10]|nr:recombination regulator RecX [Desulfosarcina sp. OttesenSCG-928-G10]